jgi:threonine/homoserine/homoserine lactone efflux protein
VTLQRWLAFVATSAVVLVVPGPTILTMTGYVMAYGRTARVLLVSAVALGDLTAVAVSLFGVGALLAASSTMFTVVKWSGAIYILYLGCERLRGRRMTHASRDGATMGRRQLFARMFGVTVLNPKGVIFYVAFLPQFVDPDRQAFGQLLVLAITFVTLAALNAAVYAAGASLVATRLVSGSAPRMFDIVSGVLLVGAAVWAMTTHPTPR